MGKRTSEGIAVDSLQWIKVSSRSKIRVFLSINKLLLCPNEKKNKNESQRKLILKA